MATRRLIVEGARAAARNKVVRGIAVSAATAAAGKIGPAGADRWAAWRDRRRARDLAIKLARQIHGRYSEDTIIAGAPHFVVWKDGRPVEAFPPVPDLESRPELRDFEESLLLPPPELRPARRGF